MSVNPILPGLPVTQLIGLVPSFLSRTAIEKTLDITAGAVNTAAGAYANAGLMMTRLASGVREAGVARVPSERDRGVAPFFLTKKDHFIETDDGVNLLLAELNFDREEGAADDSGLVRGDDPALFYSHGMFMNSNSGLYSIDGRGPVPNLDTIRTFLGFFAFLGFRVFYLHMRNCEHVQNRFIRNHSRLVTDPNLRPDLRGVRYEIPEGTTFDVMERYDIGTALRYMVEECRCERIIPMLHSLGADMMYDYLGRRLPYSENCVGFVPLCGPLRWKYDNEALIQILVRISRNTDAINGLLEHVGSDRRTNPLGFLSERTRLASEMLAGFSPAVGLLYYLGTHLPYVGDALKTLRNVDGGSGGVGYRALGKFIRKCLEPMPPLMVEHFMRIVRSEAGNFTHSDTRTNADVLSKIKVPVLAIAGERDGLADSERNIAPDFKKLGSRKKRIHVVRGGDHFTTIVGPQAPKLTWFVIAKWLHEMGFYQSYDAEALEMLYRRYLRNF